ncbi:hypothetical protein LFER_1027 [Limosilactobacillus fermentum]|uniref:beta-1,6-N-acetylglucosaminyltransferase n=1 Tax=Limosilactobacillus fermentum TaxID=1613 RepID=UPI0005DE1A57|nr:beta-1,6-N-acetylglucosaminyltransferase [Limosilactobacillus fermentum]CDN25880.1 hypothetical protein LFER_1027 [Limosilactobacillus fermentum]
MQAVLILAHENEGQLLKLVSTLTGTFEVYIHIDQKMALSSEAKEELDTNKRVHYFSKYDVKWGSFNIVRATVGLMKWALKSPSISYVHLISGQDWPLQDPRKIYDYFENNQRIYMDFYRVSDAKKSGESLLWWIKFWFNYDQVNRRSTFGKVYHRVLLVTQRLIRVNRLKKYGFRDGDVFSGQEWIDVPRDALEYAIKIWDTDLRYQKLFSHSFCPDEFWLQTILGDTQYDSRIDCNIHRYINWERENGKTPATLDERDYAAIKKGNYFFGRKVKFPDSTKLLEKLKLSE